ncbi:MAG: hypothetical protein IKJ62_04450 [Alphaproteobacteria bacterium]|nr:hypothetical protein [Alphaproteobacteria bacterium]
MKDTKTNTYIKSFYCILLGLTLFLGCNTTPTSEKQESTPKTVADTTKIETKRDTVLVLDYKPRAKHSQSTTYATNKSGNEYKILQFTNLPVERGDEIVIDMQTHTTPDGKTRTEYKLVKNLTTEKLKQEYMKKR